MYHNLYTPVQHLPQPQINSGGLCWVVFAKWEDVAVWPEIDPATGQCYTSFQLRPGCTWYEWKVPHRGRILVEDEKITNQGPMVDFNISGFFPGNNSQHTLAISAMVHHQFVVMVKDRDGQVRFIGDPDTGARFGHRYSSEDIGGIRRRTMAWTWQSPNVAPIYLGTLPEILDNVIHPPFGSSGDFSNDFSNDFNN